LLEVYLDAVTKIFEADAVTATEFVAAFIGKYLSILKREKKYFIDLMSDHDLTKFDTFRRDNEFDLLSKRIRPWIVGCNDFADLCRSIDALHQVMLTTT